MTGFLYRKSSRSNTSGGSCVEVARNIPNVVAVRDSKDPDGPHLEFAPDTFGHFLRRVAR